MSVYYADFETSPYDENKHNSVRVYAWAMSKYNDKSLTLQKGNYGVDIKSFLNKCIEESKKYKGKNIVINYHNLRFDFSYILDYLAREINLKPRINLNYIRAICQKYDYDINDVSIYTYTDNTVDIALFPDSDKELMHGRQKGVKVCYLINKALNFNCPFERVVNKYIDHLDFYETLQTARGSMFNATIKYNGVVIKFKDTAKLLPMKLAKIPLPAHIKAIKGDINHKVYREYKTVEELENDTEVFKYLTNDIIVLREGHIFMTEMFKSLNANVKATTASTAYNTYKQTVKEFNELFPTLPTEMHNFISESYRGGVATPKEEIKGVIFKCGMSVDERSEYPSVMENYFLPYGMGTWVKHHHELNKNNWYACEVTFTSACVKKNKFPLIPKTGLMKATQKYSKYNYNESGSYRLVLSKNDYNYFIENYDIENFRFVKGLEFKTKKGMFTEYIKVWFKVKDDYSKIRDELLSKEHLTEDDETKLSQATAYILISKLMLNSLYGKFGTKLIVESSISIYDENKIFNIFYSETGKQFYNPIASAVTDYARYDLVNLINPNYDRWLYSDTDSNHFSGWEPLKITGACKPIGDKLGDWEIEGYYNRMCFIKPKTYAEEYANHTYNNKKLIGTVKFKSAGINCDFKAIGFKNFKSGFVVKNGKTMLKTVKGGKAVVKTDVKL